MQENDFDLIKDYTVEELLYEINSKKMNLENMIIPVTFKRLAFHHLEEFKVGPKDFYGNIIVYTDKPKTISALSLLIIYNLQDYGYDRYSIIMNIVNICENSKSSEEVIDSLIFMYDMAMNPEDEENEEIFNYKLS